MGETTRLCEPDATTGLAVLLTREGPVELAETAAVLRCRTTLSATAATTSSATQATAPIAAPITTIEESVGDAELLEIDDVAAAELCTVGGCTTSSLTSAGLTPFDSMTAATRNALKAPAEMDDIDVTFAPFDAAVAFAISAFSEARVLATRGSDMRPQTTTFRVKSSVAAAASTRARRSADPPAALMLPPILLQLQVARLTGSDGATAIDSEDDEELRAVIVTSESGIWSAHETAARAITPTDGNRTACTAMPPHKRSVVDI